MINEKEILKIFEDVGAFVKNTHVVYASGKHGDTYINKDALYMHTEKISLLCKQIAEKFSNYNVDIVVAPATGGVILSQWVGYHLTNLTHHEILAIYADKIENGKFILKRGYNKLVKNKNILVLEDVLNSGKSAKEVVEIVRLLNGNIVGVGALLNRGGVTLKDIGDVPKLFTLLNINLPSWKKENCTLCAKNIPLNKELGRA